VVWGRLYFFREMVDTSPTDVHYWPTKPVRETQRGFGYHAVGLQPRLNFGRGVGRNVASANANGSGVVPDNFCTNWV
jgi:hypothetical protein